MRDSLPTECACLELLVFSGVCCAVEVFAAFCATGVFAGFEGSFLRRPALPGAWTGLALPDESVVVREGLGLEGCLLGACAGVGTAALRCLAGREVT